MVAVAFHIGFTARLHYSQDAYSPGFRLSNRLVLV